MTPLESFNLFCQNQIARLLKEEQGLIKIHSANATLVRHAVGRKKPSLSQQEQEERTWAPRPTLRYRKRS